jgi:hypothetical protein
MHSFDAPSGATYFHNGDFSGTVEVIARILETEEFDSDTGKVEIPFEDMKALVAQHVRNARIEAIENGDDYSLEAISALEEMSVDEVLGVPVAKPTTPTDPPATPVTRLIKLQPAEFIDNISDDGHIGRKLPYPFYITEAGYVEGQDFWRGDPIRVVGFQRDLARMEIDLWWSDAVREPHSAIGMYLVTTDAKGGMGVHQTAIASIEVIER